MKERDRINDAINRVAPSVAPIGRNDPTALSTRDGFVYRETGFDQINDIIESGYVRANEKRTSNQVWWTYGGSNSFHVNKRPVLVASSDVVQDFGTGAISINDLVEVWIYDEESKTWNNKIDEIRAMYAQNQKENNLEDPTSIKHR